MAQRTGVTGSARHNPSRDELAVLVREYLMAGHLIDRAGMPFVIALLGRDGMRDVAIDEWSAASPVYTKRMQRALDFEGDSVETIFKGMQFDIGAPPQFLDFRYAVDDHDHGEFWLDHCGALADVEPMGADFVVAMCHEIEDPTFDATACATNPQAEVRPIHRPPRVPADRAPVCRWSVTIDPDREPVAAPAAFAAVARTRAAALDLTPIVPAGPGRWRYDGPLLADVRLEDWSHSALVRIADEVCLQGHLLALSFRAAIEHRISDPHVVDDLVRHQLTGAAGIAATRIVRSMPLGDGPAAVAALLEVHPALLPADYTGVTVDDGDAGVTVRVSRSSLGVGDGGWAAALASGPLGALDAIAAAVDPRLGFVESDVSDDVARVATLVPLDEPRPRADAVALAQLSTGAAFEFRDRGVPVAVAVSRRRPG